MKRGFLFFVVLMLLTKTCISQTVNTRSLTDNVSVILKIDKIEYIKGQLIDVLVTIKNNTSDTITFPWIRYAEYLTHKNLNVTKEGNRNINEETPAEKICPHEEYCFFTSPEQAIRYSEGKDGFSYPWNFFPEGNFEYYLSWNLGGATIESNRIEFTILPIPDSLMSQFDGLSHELRDSSYNFNRGTYLFDQYESSLKNNLGKFYEREYLVQLFDGYNYLEALHGDEPANKIYSHVCDMMKNYILKYPNNTQSISTLANIIFYQNHANNSELLKEILRELNRVDYADKYKGLLKVLKSDKILQSQLKKNMKGSEK